MVGRLYQLGLPTGSHRTDSRLPGHNAVHHRFNLSGVPEGIAGPVITEVGKNGVPASRRMIFASFEDMLLKRTEPEYMRAIEVACEGDPAKLRAWKYGDWSVISASAFDGIFLNTPTPSMSSHLSFRRAASFG
jgi:hypothetical protein